MITDLRLQHFRSFTDGSFELSPGVNIVVGPNAVGKTNLLEALLVLARGNSYRAGDGELVQYGQPWARLDGHSQTSALRTVKIILEPAPAKSYELDGRVFKRLSRAHSLPVVLFEPNHLQLLSGSPQRRRDYLDDLLEQTTAGYRSARQQYKRALAQRNRLLKQPGQLSATQLFPWNIRLSQLAGQVVRARGTLVAKINKDITALYKELAGTKTIVTASYASSWPPEAYESRLLNKLESSLNDDKLRGFTGSGPHREDLAVLFNGRPLQQTASRGEFRTAILALKIIELKIVEAANSGQTPLLLLDDVFSELDGKRRHALTDYLKKHQTFITTTDADLVLQYFAANCHIIPLT